MTTLTKPRKRARLAILIAASLLLAASVTAVWAFSSTEEHVELPGKDYSLTDETTAV